MQLSLLREKRRQIALVRIDALLDRFELPSGEDSLDLRSALFSSFDPARDHIPLESSA